MSEWIEHDGSGMPVSANTPVFVKFRDGSSDDWCANPWSADDWHDTNAASSNWVHAGRDSDIVAYRIVS